MAVILSGANGSLYFSCGIYGASGKIQGFFTAFRMTITGYTGTKTGIEGVIPTEAQRSGGICWSTGTVGFARKVDFSTAPLTVIAARRIVSNAPDSVRDNAIPALQ